MRAYTYIGTSNSPTPAHVMDTLIIKGELYSITKVDDTWVKVTGRLGNKLGGSVRVTDKWMTIESIKPHLKLA